ncbi:MAG TPA: hypothetical protein VMX35_08070 [Acidobacteriota bacterium]|nr:hypothetical protein [Acidobacteriota bacterium]
MSEDVYSIVFYRDGEQSAAPLFPNSLPEALEMLKQIRRMELMPGIDADTAELRKGNAVVKFVELDSNTPTPSRRPSYYSELWSGEKNGQ